jgi:Tol biopolymer transport system component
MIKQFAAKYQFMGAMIILMVIIIIGSGCQSDISPTVSTPQTITTQIAQPSTTKLSSIPTRDDAMFVATNVLASHTPNPPVKPVEMTSQPGSSVSPTQNNAVFLLIISSNRSAIPVGQYIVYLRLEGEKEEFWVINSNGTYQERLISNIPNLEVGVFNSDATKLAFVIGVGYMRYNLYLYDLQTNAIQEVLQESNCSFPSWAPGGEMLALQCDASIAVLSLSDNSLTVLANGGEEYDAFFWTPVWSFDGEKIAYISVPGGPRSGIWITDPACALDSSTCLAQTSGPYDAIGKSYVPPLAWSPDGRSLAVNSGGSWAATNLDIFDIQSEVSRTLVKNISLSGVAWSPDGERLAYSDGPSIYVMPIESSAPTLLVNNMGVVISWIIIPHPFTAGDLYTISEAGADLNLRAEPALTGDVLRKLQAGDIVTILDGPVDADGYTWWQVQAEDGSTGWAVNIPEWYVPVGEEAMTTPVP